MGTGATISVSGSGEEIGALAASVIVSSLTEESRTEILTWAMTKIIERDSVKDSWDRSRKVPSMLENAVAAALDKKIADVAREMIEQGYGDIRMKVAEHINTLIGGLVGNDEAMLARVRMAVMRELSTDVQ